MIARNCENCDFWEKLNDNGGTCKRYPPKATPQAVQVAGRVVTGQRPSPVNFLDIISWPKTKPEDWCGEFKNE